LLHIFDAKNILKLEEQLVQRLKHKFLNKIA